ncbi:MAG: CDP-alcohol phosphatidyltransferase family protein [Lentisphaeria bacterium]|jgi:CDP-diacylglycerol--serine O-phosphatidyltransferase|nr:CDP-alcohol phosphatidyltransferase family protein [Lentisphaeria bacterium]
MSLRDAKILKIVPNSLTIGNSLCGFIAILYTLCAYGKNDPSAMLKVFVVSSWMIFAAMVFDALDGLAARAFHAASMTGIQMDSLADMVTFGVAPATLVAIMTHVLRDKMTAEQILLTYALCSVYLGCAALRLAIYNVKAITEHKNSKSFSGLPSPGGAAAICVTIFFVYSLSTRETSGIDLNRLAFILPGYAALLGLLMVSNIPYLHVGKWLVTMGRSRRKLVLFIVLMVLVAIFRVYALAAIVTGYIISGPLSLLLPKKVRQRIFED